MRLDNHHPLHLEAEHQTGVEFHPRTRSSGSSISDRSSAAEFGRRVPRVTMFRETKRPLGLAHLGDQTHFDPKGVFPSASQGPSNQGPTNQVLVSDLQHLEFRGSTSVVRNMRGIAKNPVGPISNTPTALLRKNLAMAK
jgi:hypothetical protein